ncbi:putative 50S ribosomal protein L16 [Cardiosporidium cionae]|uniref:50S ribosomal protein L16 n=1 Tax=Cardiosporidium cionae TaxID=476202 RepID=A0ABQ7J905_9APIC|nr:putative 50S ribosomal protein L16 [Cardiosporidium cionae]|eukprot:KAF8820481.1 putative 50S ribosomal protein L16 [Cardiosporidium cionae]
MPPIKYKPPLPVRLKAPKGRILPLSGPDLRMGKSIVASSPQRVTAEQLDEARKALKRRLGKNKEFYMNVHATYAVTRKPEGTKQGQGKGAIDRYVARVPAGKVLFHIPSLNPFNAVLEQPPNYEAFRSVLGKLPMPCHFRSHNNSFKMNSLQFLTEKKLEQDKQKRENIIRNKLIGEKLP